MIRYGMTVNLYYFFFPLPGEAWEADEGEGEGELRTLVQFGLLVCEEGISPPFLIEPSFITTLFSDINSLLFSNYTLPLLNQYLFPQYQEFQLLNQTDLSTDKLNHELKATHRK